MPGNNAIEKVRLAKLKKVQKALLLLSDNADELIREGERMRSEIMKSIDRAKIGKVSKLIEKIK